MILKIIENHLSNLAEAKSKGITPYLLESIEPNKRLAISQVTREVELSARAWNKALESTCLIEFVNRTTLPKNVVDLLLICRYSASDIHQVIGLPYIESVYAKLQQTDLNKTTYHYSGNERLSISDWFVDVLGYMSTFGLGEGGMSDLFNTIKSMKNNGYTEEHYSILPTILERVRMIRMWNTDYLDIDDLSTRERYPFLLACLPFSDLIEEINEAIGTDTTKDILLSLHKSLTNSGDTDKLISNIRLILEGLSPNIVSEWFVQLFGEKDGLVLDSEIHNLATNHVNHFSTNVYEVIYGQNSLAFDVLRDAKEYDPHQVVLMKRCIGLGKKGFLRLIIGERAREIFLHMGKHKLLFQETFSKIVNLNTLNEKNLLMLNEMDHHAVKLEQLNPDISLTFEEFHFLFGKNKLDIDFYYFLSEEFSVGERLRIARELPELSKVRHIFQSDDELYAGMIELLRVKPMKQWVKEKGLKLNNAEDHHYLTILLVPERFEKFKQSVKTGVDVDFIMRETELLSLADTLHEAKLMFVEKDETCQFLLEKLNVSREFIEKYKVNIINFYEKGLCKIFKTLHESSKIEENQKHNLNLITKAELTGKLKDLKFVKDDFKIEIGLPVSSQVITEWINNRSRELKEWNITETYDYETTLRLGQYPVWTCQNWDNGSYSQCLLSNFDTNKKLIVVKGRKGHVVARAIIRLTKGSDKFIPKDEPVKKKRLGFVDVEEETKEVVVKEKSKPKEELVLFLERCYTSMDGKIAKEVRREIVKLAIEKSKLLGAKLVLAQKYAEDDLEELKGFESEEYYIFISYSKNGFQYLDSLSGQAGEDNEGNYKRGNLLLQAD